MNSANSFALGRTNHEVPRTICSWCSHGAPSGPASNRLNSADTSSGPRTDSNRYFAPRSKLVTRLAGNSGIAGLKVPGHSRVVRANSPLNVKSPKMSFA